MRLRLAIGALGAALVLYGAYGVLTHAADTKPVTLLIWLVGGIALHDLVIAPVTALLAWVLTRTVGPAARPVVVTGLVVLASVVAVALPPVVRQGQNGGNASVLPLDYRDNLLGVVLGIALVTALLAVRAARARRSADER